MLIHLLEVTHSHHSPSQFLTNNTSTLNKKSKKDGYDFTDCKKSHPQLNHSGMCTHSYT